MNNKKIAHCTKQRTEQEYIGHLIFLFYFNMCLPKVAHNLRSIPYHSVSFTYQTLLSRPPPHRSNLFPTVQTNSPATNISVTEDHGH